MVFDKIANVLRSGVNAAGGFEPLLEKAHNAEDRAKPDDDHVDEYAVTVKMGITLGTVDLRILPGHPAKGPAQDRGHHAEVEEPDRDVRSKEWQEQIGEQVRRSQVTLEARVRLESLTLATVSRLMAGDVIRVSRQGRR